MNSLCDENPKNQRIFLRLRGKVSSCIDAGYWNGFLNVFQVDFAGYSHCR